MTTDTMMMPEAPTPPAYPVRLEIERPAKQSRLLGFPLLVGHIIRFILLVPSLLILYGMAYGAILAFLFSLWGILFTGRYPRGLFMLVAGYQRWGMNVSAYLLNLFDEYPPMDLDQRPDRALRYEVDYPEHPNRWLNLPFFPIKIILLIPHLLVLTLLGILAGVIVFIAQFAILFSGSFPAGLHRFVVGYLRWSTRANAYLYALTDKYPPFSMN